MHEVLKSTREAAPVLAHVKNRQFKFGNTYNRRGEQGNWIEYTYTMNRIPRNTIANNTISHKTFTSCVSQKRPFWEITTCQKRVMINHPLFLQTIMIHNTMFTPAWITSQCVTSQSCSQAHINETHCNTWVHCSVLECVVVLYSVLRLSPVHEFASIK